MLYLQRYLKQYFLLQLGTAYSTCVEKKFGIEMRTKIFSRDQSLKRRQLVIKVADCRTLPKKIVFGDPEQQQIATGASFWPINTFKNLF